MSGQTLAAGTVGWFGKLPAAGDFFNRGLPADFLHAWDAWLQAGMIAGASMMGEQWKDHYLRFPVWHFLRHPAHHETAADMGLWAGLLAPSIDRVGRLYPMTIAFEIPFQEFMSITFAAVQHRLDEIESFTLGVLGDDDIAGFEQKLASLSPLAAGSPGTPPVEPRSAEQLIDYLGKQAMVEQLLAQTVFWTRSGPVPSMLSLREPLEADSFCKLVGAFKRSMSDCHGT